MHTAYTTKTAQEFAERDARMNAVMEDIKRKARAERATKKPVKRFPWKYTNGNFGYGM